MSVLCYVDEQVVVAVAGLLKDEPKDPVPDVTLPLLTCSNKTSASV